MTTVKNSYCSREWSKEWVANNCFLGFFLRKIKAILISEYFETAIKTDSIFVTRCTNQFHLKWDIFNTVYLFSASLAQLYKLWHHQTGTV